MWSRLGLQPTEALLVIVSAIGVYVAFTVLIRLLGQRSIARMSTFDVLLVLVVGSVAGRVITGYTPSLAAGVLALIVLFATHLAVQRLARRRVLASAGGVSVVRRGVPLDRRLFADVVGSERIPPEDFRPADD